MSHALPSLSVATHHRQPFYDLVPRDPERQAPLFNNAQIRVAPRESTPNPQAGRAFGSDSSVSTGFGLPGHHIWGRALAGQGWTNKETMSLLARDVSKTAGSSPAHTRFQMVNQLGPPQEIFDAR